MSLLFDAPLLPGLEYRPNVIGEADQRALIDQLDALELAPFRFHGWVGNRRTQSFGWRYDFDDSSFTPTAALPDWLQPLRAPAAALADVAPGDFVHGLVARYDPGAGIGWHRDRDVFDRVVGFSLGSPATLRFRRRLTRGFERAALVVEPGSAYLLSGPARCDWEHSIAPGTARRYSITLRTLSAKGAAIVSGT